MEGEVPAVEDKYLVDCSNLKESVKNAVAQLEAYLLLEKVDEASSGKSAQEILETAGLQRIAARLCEEEGLESMEDLGKLSAMEIDGIAWLKDAQKMKLKDLCEACRRGDHTLMKSISEDARPAHMEWVKSELEKVEKRL
jgi:6-pyruvoyl-tetrahydropterin synthase